MARSMMTVVCRNGTGPPGWSAPCLDIQAQLAETGVGDRRENTTLQETAAPARRGVAPPSSGSSASSAALIDAIRPSRRSHPGPVSGRCFWTLPKRENARPRAMTSTITMARSMGKLL